MKQYLEEEVTANVGSCATTNSRNLWLVGGAVVLLLALFCVIIFKPKNTPLPIQDTPQPLIVLPGAQQAAFVNPNCAICPNFNQCFPQGTGGAQQVAFVNPNCATDPNFNQCFPQGLGGGAQQVALVNPSCVPCPSFTQCFPQAPTSTQQVALTQNTSMLTCPYCNFSYNDSSAGSRGFSRCPRCLGIMTFSSQKQTTPPPIFRDSVMPHKYRGVCENCHIIKPDIAIQASATPPHEYRGVCSNCHTILGLKAQAK